MGDAIYLRDLRIEAADRVLVDGVSLTCQAGELVAVVGASGSGKTLTCRSLLGLVDVVPGVVRADLTVLVDQIRHQPWLEGLGRSRRARDRAFRGIRGGIVGYLPQHAGAALDPTQRVGPQVSGAARLGGQPDAPEPFLEQAGFGPTDAAQVVERFPHELSGGMAQRVAVAQLLARGSRFVIADEPMTGLDAPVQQRLAGHLRRLAERGLGVVVVTHDLRLVHEIADRVVLIDQGRVAERFTHAELSRGLVTTEAGRRLLKAMA